jgi:hypothetical protein
MPESPTQVIRRVGTERLLIPIIGTAPLIMHRWSEKARRELLESQQGKKKIKTPLDPQAEYEASSYRIEGVEVPILGRDPRTPVETHSTESQARRNAEDAERGRDPQMAPIETVEGPVYGFPALAFKSATVETFRFFDKSVTKVMLQQSLYFKGVFSKSEPMSLVRIYGEPQMREDIVTVGMGTQPRYRAEFEEWRAVLDVRYVTATLDPGTVLNLIESGGMFVGVGEWRPEKSGESGTYEIDDTREVVAVQEGGDETPLEPTTAAKARR